MRSNLGELNRRWFMAAMIIAAAVIFSMVATPMEGADTGTSLVGSNFEIDSDANLNFDHAAPSIDWANVSEIKQNDEPDRSKDDSFGKGTKEDTPVPAAVTGSIPPNKSDLKAFGVYLEENGTDKFMHLFWTRAQDPKGTTNMDFEFNQSNVISSNNVTPIRTGGDLLIEYKLSKGGTEPELWRYTWIDGSGALTASDCEASSSLPCWGGRTELTAPGDAAGSINTSLISAGDSEGMGALDPYTFGEASLDLKSIFDPKKCTSFGSVYLKSRSSDSFTSALKDFIKPHKIILTNCGTVIIRKVTDPAGATDAFRFTSTVLTESADGSTFFLSDEGSETIKNVLAGGHYSVTEDNLEGSGWDLTSATCNDGSDPGDISLLVGETVICTFTNTKQGQIIVRMETIPSGDSQSFTFTPSYGSDFDLTDFNLETTRPQNESRFLKHGLYSVSQTVPAGWDPTSATCDDGESTPGAISLQPGETVTCTFTNTKRGTIIIEKQTLPDGDLAQFDFSGHVAGSLSDGGQSVPLEVLPGIYTSTETVPPGWDLTAITCDDGESDVASSGNILTYTATFNVEPGETVICTFTNTKLFTIITLVCHADQLYFSTVGLVDGPSVQTLPTLADWSSTDFNPCTLTGARFENMSTGPHRIMVTIPSLP